MLNILLESPLFSGILGESVFMYRGRTIMGRTSGRLNHPNLSNYLYFINSFTWTL